MRNRRNAAILLAVVVAAILVVGLVGCTGSGGSTGTGTGGYPTAPSSGGSSSGGSAGGTTIVEQNFQFNPSTLTVKVGDTVTFKNQDSTNHHVVVGTKDLGDQPPGQDVTWTADKAGTVDVKCTIHPSMTGQITVQ